MEGQSRTLKNENTIIIKEAAKASAVVIWDREDYLKEAKNQLNYKNVYKKLIGEVEGPLEKIIKPVLKNIRDRRETSDNILDYYLVKSLSFNCCPKSKRDFKMFLAKPVIVRKTFQSS